MAGSNLPLVACRGGSTRAARGVRRSNAGAIKLFLLGVVEDCGDALGLNPGLTQHIKSI